MLLFAGDLTAAASLTDELQAVKEATGSGLAPYGALGLAALSGDEAGASALIDATVKDVTRRREGLGSPSPGGRTPRSTTASATMTKLWPRASVPPLTTRILPRSAGLWSS